MLLGQQVTAVLVVAVLSLVALPQGVALGVALSAQLRQYFPIVVN